MKEIGVTIMWKMFEETIENIGRWIIDKIRRSLSARAESPVGMVFISHLYPPAATEEKEYLEEISYEGVKWKSYIWKETFISLYENSPERVEVEIPPRCPKCGTQLKEIKRWKGYLWKCPSCNFRKKSKESYFLIAESVRKIAMRKFELKAEEWKREQRKIALEYEAAVIREMLRWKKEKKK